MNKIALIFLFAFAFFMLNTQAASAETFAPVEMYISGGSDGQLRIGNPSGSSVETITIADGETGQGTFQELGRWTTSSLKTDFNISGEWNGNAWVSSDNRDATITIRYTLIQNEESIQQFEFSGDVNYGESAQLTGSADFSLTSLDASPLTLLVESSWSGRGPPPPLTEGNTSITFDYGASSKDTTVTFPISHLQIFAGDDPISITGQNAYYVFVEVYDVFGVDDVLSLENDDYSMKMGPEGETLWSASVDKVSKKSDFVEVKFVWSYEGKTLPAGENIYLIEIDARDLLSDLDWSKNLQTSIFIEPEPDIEINPVTSTSKTVEFGKAAIYTISIENTGSGVDEFIVVYDNNDGWDVSVDLTDVELEPGDSQNIKISVTPPDTTSNGQESPTQVTVTASSDSDVSESITLVTTAVEPEPNWDFSVIINEEDSEAYDYSSDRFIIRDRASIEIHFSVLNEGNDQNNFNVKAISVENAFSSSFDQSIISSLPQDQMDSLILTLTPREDYFGTNTFIEIEVTSAADGRSQAVTLEIFLEQSGNIIGDSNSQLKVSIGKSQIHTISIFNNANEPKQIYFGVSGKGPSDKLAESWFSFSDKNSKNIAPGSFLIIYPSLEAEITVTVSVPSNSELGSYNMDIWMLNEQNAQISNLHSIQIVTIQAEETEDSNIILYTALVLVLGGVLVYGYRNFYVDDGYEDEYDDFDELEDVPEIFEELPSSNPEPVVAPVAALEPEVAAPAAVMEPEVNVPVSAAEPVVAAPMATVDSPVEATSKPRKKWFGLFGSSEVQAESEPVVAAPVAAEPVVAAPVAAEPVVVAPVAAEPVVAAPVAAEPVVAAPVAAEPVVAAPVVAEPVVAEPVAAEPVVAQVVIAEPVQEDE